MFSNSFNNYVCKFNTNVSTPNNYAHYRNRTVRLLRRFIYVFKDVGRISYKTRVLKFRLLPVYNFSKRKTTSLSNIRENLLTEPRIRIIDYFIRKRNLVSIIPSQYNLIRFKDITCLQWRTNIGER